MQITFEVIKRKAWEHAKSQTLNGISSRKSKVCVYVGQKTDSLFIEKLHFARNDL
jgi:hypothetical protein